MNHHVRESQSLVVLEPQLPARASVVWLHGLGADAYDFVPLVPELALPPDAAIRFLFPHAPVRPITINAGYEMRAWYDVLGLDRSARQDEAGIRASADLVRALIEHEIAAGIPASAIVVAGFSQGGAIALHTGLRFTQRLAGILGLSTYLPLHGALAGEAAAANRDVPILMCHGRFDPMLPIALGAATRDFLRNLGYPLDWREYPMQHEVSREEIDDVSAWLRDRLDAACGGTTG
jgi:phospholipase/carboxylesterase